MNQGVEAFHAISVQTIGIYIGVYFMEEHQSDSGYFESSEPYDLHQYTSRKLVGLTPSRLKSYFLSKDNKEETFKKAIRQFHSASKIFLLLAFLI